MQAGVGGGGGGPGLTGIWGGRGGGEGALDRGAGARGPKGRQGCTLGSLFRTLILPHAKLCRVRRSSLSSMPEASLMSARLKLSMSLNSISTTACTNQVHDNNDNDNNNAIDMMIIITMVMIMVMIKIMILIMILIMTMVMTMVVDNVVDNANANDNNNDNDNDDDDDNDNGNDNDDDNCTDSDNEAITMMIAMKKSCNGGDDRGDTSDKHEMGLAMGVADCMQTGNRRSCNKVSIAESDSDVQRGAPEIGTQRVPWLPWRSAPS